MNTNHFLFLTRISKAVKMLVKIRAYKKTIQAAQAKLSVTFFIISKMGYTKRKEHRKISRKVGNLYIRRDLKKNKNETSLYKSNYEIYSSLF